MSDRLGAVFPGLRTTSFQVTSPADPIYNCIAWAAGSTTHWWWPLDDPPRTHWPPGVPREITIDAFLSAFMTLGYAVCSDGRPEAGFQKVVLFADSQGTPTHAARQLPTGRWTSKLGQSEDIEHDLRALEGDIYGTVAAILKRAERHGPE